MLILGGVAQAFAETPDPGDRIRVTLQNGNELEGVVLELDPEGYRVDLEGAKIFVSSSMIQNVEVLSKSGRPAKPNFRGRQGPSPNIESANADEARRDSNIQDIPPKPRSRGGGFLTSGITLTAVGLAAMVGGGYGLANAASDSVGFDDDFDDDSDGESALLASVVVLGLAATVSGLGLTVTGIVLKAVSGSKRRRWEQTYGQIGVPDSLWLTVVPPATLQGVTSIVVGGRF